MLGRQLKKIFAFCFLAASVAHTHGQEPCNLNFTDPEADVEILQRPDSAEECNYLVTVYLGYGIEVQVSTKGFLMAQLITQKVVNKHALGWF
ncbi:unnamed protein product [Tetraodon nigroviridis]|uniref:(spotted green pufferfish) hypothetical protein n=1 Tax=Tetraodon nigroviridis TaxID=99883 RepID=Q4S8N1_TETNG|nr:unnamed protein product [Tetraodon nigroviridis]